MKKRLFQILDEMNVNDGANKTATCACCFDMVSANTAKGGAHVTMGIPTEALHKIMHDEYKPMLVLLDMKEYHRLDAIPANDELQTAIARAERAERALREICGYGGVLVPEKHTMIAIANNALTPKTGEDE